MIFTPSRSWICRITCIGCIGIVLGCGAKPAAGPSPQPPAVAPPSIVTIVSEPASDQTKSVFKRIRDRYDYGVRNGLPETPHAPIANQISGIATELALIPAPRADEANCWTKLTLNVHGIGFDAVRFEGSDIPGDLVYAFAIDSADLPRVQFLAITESWKPLDIPPVFESQKKNVSIADLPSDEASAILFGHIPGQQIRPLNNYVIALLINGKDPLDIYVRLSLFNERVHKVPVIATTHDAAAALGLPLPFKFNSNAVLTDYAFEEHEIHGPDAAMSFLEEKLGDKPDWKAWHLYVHIACTHASKLLAEEQEKDALAVYLRAAAGVRKLRDTPRPLEESPCELIPQMLYNEARALCRSGRATDSIGALREAVAAGWTDIALIRGDESFDSLHDIDEFKRLIIELEAR